MTRFPGAPRGSYVNEGACDHGATTRTQFHSMILMDGERGVECGVCLEAFKIVPAYGGGDNPIDGSETVDV